MADLSILWSCMNNMAALQFVGVHLLLLARFGFAQNCKNMDFKVTVDTKALRNHVISNQPANDDGHCESKCFLDDRCISYNFGRDAIGTLGMCELNEADHVMYPEDLVPRDDTMYRMAENECRCSRDQWCRPDFINYSFRCKCKPVQEKKYVSNNNCKEFSESNGEFYLDASDSSKKGYCLATINNSDCVEVKADPYRLTVDIYSGRTDSGPTFYPAFGFNVKDSKNFDFVYFRLHKSDICIQPGYVKNGCLTQTTTFCNPPNPPPVNTWFKVTAEVSESTMKLFIDGKFVGQNITTALPLRPKGILMVYNTYNNIAKFRNYSVWDL